jgi:osmotically-inducible protein OsmY
MGSLVTEPIAYLVAHLHEAMLTDDRLYEQAIEIVVVGDRLELRGEVATPERRAAAVQLARDLASGIEVVDDLRVSGLAGPDDPETL